MGYHKQLYERRKGKTAHTTVKLELNTWQKLVTWAVGLVMAAGGAILVWGLLGKRASLIIAGAAVTFAGGVLIGLWLARLAVFKKEGKTSETHYRTVDYTYNGITGEETDNGREITREEFYGKRDE